MKTIAEIAEQERKQKEQEKQKIETNTPIYRLVYTSIEEKCNMSFCYKRKDKKGIVDLYINNKLLTTVTNWKSIELPEYKDNTILALDLENNLLIINCLTGGIKRITEGVDRFIDITDLSYKDTESKVEVLAIMRDKDAISIFEENGASMMLLSPELEPIIELKSLISINFPDDKDINIKDTLSHKDTILRAEYYDDNHEAHRIIIKYNKKCNKYEIDTKRVKEPSY